MGNKGTAVVTGASGGIGEELSRLLAADGYDLALVARNTTRLETLASELQEKHRVGVVVVTQDLSDPTAPKAIYAEMQRRGAETQILINNAGFGTYGPFAGAELSAELQMLQVNITALTHLTRLFLPGMVRAGRGRVMNVASTAAFQPGPLMAVYYASKAYVLSFSEAIAEELRGTGVTVTALCPGATASGFQERASMQRSRLVQGKLMDAAAVARIGCRGMMQGKPVVVPGLRHQLMSLTPRFLPRGLVTRIVRKIQEPTL